MIGSETFSCIFLNQVSFSYGFASPFSAQRCDFMLGCIISLPKCTHYNKVYRAELAGTKDKLTTISLLARVFFPQMLHILYFPDQNCCCPFRNPREGDRSDSFPFILARSRCWHQNPIWMEAQTGKDAVSVSLAAMRHHLMCLGTDREDAPEKSPYGSAAEIPHPPSNHLLSYLHAATEVSISREDGRNVWKCHFRMCLLKSTKKGRLASLPSRSCKDLKVSCCLQRGK